MQYFVTEGYCVGVISKNGTNSFCEAQVRHSKPNAYEELKVADNDFTFRSMVEQTDKPDRPVVLMVRDPIERFISAVSMNNCAISIAEVIKDLQTGGEWSKHPLYQRQSDFMTDARAHGMPVILFSFPRDIKLFCETLGFEYPLPHRNENKGEKAKLAKNIGSFLQEYYSDDITLYAKASAI